MYTRQNKFLLTWTEKKTLNGSENEKTSWVRTEQELQEEEQIY